jgi:hypothetical protein
MGDGWDGAENVSECAGTASVATCMGSELTVVGSVGVADGSRDGVAVLVRDCADRCQRLVGPNRSVASTGGFAALPGNGLRYVGARPRCPLAAREAPFVAFARTENGFSAALPRAVDVDWPSQQHSFVQSAAAMIHTWVSAPLTIRDSFLAIDVVLRFLLAEHCRGSQSVSAT